MAASFSDLSIKVWDLKKILIDGTNGLDKPNLEIQNSIEISPADLNFCHS